MCVVMKGNQLAMVDYGVHQRRNPLQSQCMFLLHGTQAQEVGASRSSFVLFAGGHQGSGVVVLARAHQEEGPNSCCRGHQEA